MASPTQITISQLSRLIGLPDAPILVDICIDEDFEEGHDCPAASVKTRD